MYTTMIWISNFEIRVPIGFVKKGFIQSEFTQIIPIYNITPIIPDGFSRDDCKSTFRKLCIDVMSHGRDEPSVINGAQIKTVCLLLRHSWSKNSTILFPTCLSNPGLLDKEASLATTTLIRHFDTRLYQICTRCTILPNIYVIFFPLSNTNGKLNQSNFIPVL